MATAVKIQRMVTLPAIDEAFFAETVKRNKWELTPLAIKKPIKRLTPEQLAIIERAKRADAKVNKKAPKMTTQQIVQEIRNLRNEQ